MTKSPARLAAIPCALAALAVAGCSAETLDAGGKPSAPVVLGPAKTLATVGAMIDAVTMDGQALYFAAEDGWIYAVPKDGSSSASRIAASTAGAGGFVDGLAVDGASLYWTVQGAGQDGAVLRVSKGGGAVQTLYAHGVEPWGIAVDDDSVYWSDKAGSPPAATNDEAPKGTLARVPKAGGAMSIVANDVSSPDFVAIDGDAIVWHDASGVRRVDKSGAGQTVLLASDGPAIASNLLVAGGSAYLALDDGSWTIWSVPLSGGSPIALAQDVQQPAGVAVAGPTVVWSVAGGQGASSVLGVPAGGGAEATLAPPDTSGGVAAGRALFLLSDDAALYSVELWAADASMVVVRAQPATLAR